MITTSPSLTRRVILTLTAVALAHTSVEAQVSVAVGSASLRDLNVWTGTDTMRSLTKVNGEWRTPNGTGYVRRVGAGPDGYSLLNRWFDAAGETNAIQEYTVGPMGAWPVTVRVRAATDSASLTISGGRVIGWEFPPGEGGEARLYDFDLERASLPSDLANAMIAGMDLAEGTQFDVAYFTLLVPTAPMEERTRRLTVTGHDRLTLNGTPIDCWVISDDTDTPGTHTTMWVGVEDGRLLALRGQPPGGRFEWWHLLAGIQAPSTL